MRRQLSFVLVLLGSVYASLSGQSSQSPFAADGSAPATQSPAASEGDFVAVGVLRAGEKTQIGIVNKKTNKNFWVAVGETVERFEILSADLANETVLARFQGQSLTLKLRPPEVGKAAPAVAVAPAARPAVPPASPWAPPPGLGNGAPPAPPPGPPQSGPLTPADQEREARMLVSDLLEIGMQQRKAYEDAQKRQTAANKSATSVSPTP